MPELIVVIAVLAVFATIIIMVGLYEIAMAIRRIREAIDGKTHGPIDREQMRKFDKESR